MNAKFSNIAYHSSWRTVIESITEPSNPNKKNKFYNKLKKSINRTNINILKVNQEFNFLNNHIYKRLNIEDLNQLSFENIFNHELNVALNEDTRINRYKNDRTKFYRKNELIRDNCFYSINCLFDNQYNDNDDFFSMINLRKSAKYNEYVSLDGIINTHIRRTIEKHYSSKTERLNVKIISSIILDNCKPHNLIKPNEINEYKTFIHANWQMASKKCALIKA